MSRQFELPRLNGEARVAFRPLAVMHVPKTAGTSVTSSIASALKLPVDAWGFDRSLFGEFDEFATIDSSVLAIIRNTPAELPDARLVMGHFSRSTLATRYPDAQLLTFLREPLTRLLSYWVYWRCQSDEHLALWGTWRDRVAISRGSLRSFLTDARIACQTDNIVLRMLLWPHPDLDDGDFIPPGRDEALVDEALRRLDSFAYSDVIENDEFDTHLQAWLGSAMTVSHLNETARVPDTLRLRLDRELDAETFDLLDQRCRLDTQLWRALAQCRIRGVNIETLQRRTIARGIARYSALLAP
ncbi:hypothetical protein KTD07_26910 [Burkholderia multivorans]|uniref:hypothetical protein n=1 Tax=Burkholderia multivorans TaxID=87883 RepID=UPI001C25289C|nr:hypothetical protein [Burkholderia multivorans]MBU9152855.1 hypothetical protein [Burkholderia multivorans]MBU9486469.1 hypothetical protein [Burkholderia multivorans]